MNICNDHRQYIRKFLGGNGQMLAGIVIRELDPRNGKDCHICGTNETEKESEIDKIIDAINRTNRSMRNLIGRKLIEGTMERFGITEKDKVVINIRDHEEAERMVEYGKHIKLDSKQ